jgi:hypothetical protein
VIFDRNGPHSLTEMYLTVFNHIHGQQPLTDCSCPFAFLALVTRSAPMSGPDRCMAVRLVIEISQQFYSFFFIVFVMNISIAPAYWYRATVGDRPISHFGI